MRHKSTGGGRRSRRGGSRRGGLAAQDFEHDRAAGRALALDRLASVFHDFLNTIGDFALGLAFDAISFSHKFCCCPTLHAPDSERSVAEAFP